MPDPEAPVARPRIPPESPPPPPPPDVVTRVFGMPSAGDSAFVCPGHFINVALAKFADSSAVQGQIQAGRLPFQRATIAAPHTNSALLLFAAGLCLCQSDRAERGEPATYLTTHFAQTVGEEQRRTVMQAAAIIREYLTGHAIPPAVAPGLAQRLHAKLSA